MNIDFTATDDIDDLVDDDLVADSGEQESVLPSEAYAFEVRAGQGNRLDKFLMAALPEGIVSREKLKAVIRDGQCSLDGAVCTEPKTKVAAGQTVSVEFKQESAGLVPQQLPLTYIYKDTTLVVVDKPHGLTVHPCPSCAEVTLVHGVAYDFPQLAGMQGVRPGIVHRLDKDTSGLMIVALREDTRLRLTEAFADRRVKKTYLAIVCGIPAPKGECKEPIGRHPSQRVKMAVVRAGRVAHTEWTRLYADPKGQFSLLAVTIHTGRTHQIRVHMTHIGHPLVGDQLYATSKWKSVQVKAKRQMLHAWKLSFAHPTSGEELDFTLPMPDDMRHTLVQLAGATVRVVLSGCPGCGKSTVLEFLKEQGAAVFSADAAVSELYEAGHLGQKAVARYLGSKFLDAVTGSVNRRALFAAMQEDDAVRERVNQLIHPLVFDKLTQFWEQAEADCVPIAVAEVPLWTETRQSFGGEETPYFVGVSCKTEIRHQRLQSSRTWPRVMCEEMDEWQLAEDQKFSKARTIVNNDSTKEELGLALASLWSGLNALYAERNKVLLLALQNVS